MSSLVVPCSVSLAAFTWLPKITGRMMSREKLHKFVFTLMFLGFNLTFFPMHYLGMIGQPRRTHSYNEGHGFEAWNQIATVGSFILGVGVFIGVVQFIHSFYSKRLKPAGKNPWDAGSLEWTLSSPVKDYNFARTPIIKAQDQAWENNHGPKIINLKKSLWMIMVYTCRQIMVSIDYWNWSFRYANWFTFPSVHRRLA